MPLLDVSFITLDPMLADSFDVRRRIEVMGTNGRATPMPDQYFCAVTGVVTQQDPSDIIRTEDGQTVPRRIFIASIFQFISAVPGQQPDEITWNGTKYIVESVLPYSRFGKGTYEAILQYQGPVPAPQ